VLSGVVDAGGAIRQRLILGQRLTGRLGIEHGQHICFGAMGEGGDGERELVALGIAVSLSAVAGWRVSRPDRSRRGRCSAGHRRGLDRGPGPTFLMNHHLGWSWSHRRQRAEAVAEDEVVGAGRGLAFQEQNLPRPALWAVITEAAQVVGRVAEGVRHAPAEMGPPPGQPPPLVRLAK